MACISAPPIKHRQLAGYDFPPLTGRVVDRANILSAAAEARIVKRSERLEAETRHQLVVVTITGLGGHSIEDYGLKLGNFWGVGRRCFDDGVLVIVAPNDRKVRIEVGKGLEKVLTNAEANAIIKRRMLPAFRTRAMSLGTEQGVAAIADELTPAREKAA